MQNVKSKNDMVRMNFLEHLEELRFHILYSLLALAITTIIAYVFSTNLLDIVTAPLNKLSLNIDLVTLRPTEGFVARLKLAFITGFFISLPVLLYHFWQFITPGLKLQEKIYFIPLLICSTLFFIIGALFAYTSVLPLALAFFHSFQTNQIVDRWSLSNYISFVGQLLLGFGIVFQMPLVSFFLTKMGIITPSFLIKQWRYIITIIFVLAAFLTPPDIFTQIALAIPLILLYILSIGISKLTYKEDKTEEVGIGN